MSHLPAWFDTPRKDVNSRSKRQERERAAQLGGRATAGSGSSWRSPGDVRAEGVLEELKFTDKDSYPLKARDLLKIMTQALSTGREARFVLDFSKFKLRVTMTMERLDG